MKMSRWISMAAVFAVGLFTSVGAMAQQPHPWQMNFQKAATPVMEDIVWFHNWLLVIEVAIVILVLGLMVYIVIKFNAKANPVPSKTTHNAPLEVIWTVVPIIILVGIAVPSMKLLFFMDKAQNPEMTLKVIGNQWFWSYEYPDHGNFTFDANLTQKEDLPDDKKSLYLLEVDNHVVLPADTSIRLLFTANDVLHNWAIPSFGVKMDTVPGRINEAWIEVSSEHMGTYYGQCSELCGVNHGYMPIAVDIVSKADFAAWVEKAKDEFARADEPAVDVARIGARPAAAGR